MTDGFQTHALAAQALAAGDAQGALALACRAVTALSAEAGPAHPDTGNGWLLRARCEVATGAFFAAEPSAARSREILLAFRGGDLDRLACQALVLCGSIARQLGAHDRAAGFLADASRRAADAGTHCDPESAAALNERGVLHKARGEYTDAAACYAAAERLLAVAGGGDLDARATLLHNRAGAAHSQGELAIALTHARAGLALRLRGFPDDHPSVLGDQGALAAILLDAGHLAEAAALLSGVLSRWRRLDNRHEIAVTLHNLAVLDLTRGQLPSARRYATEALRHKEASLGSHHPDLRSTWSLLTLLDQASAR